ncbi:unnamed protein product [Durusdinium trenchii]|uniref:EF-hand domain-containing protein n=1 Tax=Durusdinium trenchii TaxID=1381693 RepID=A0ABP0KKP2_9DINO
MERSSSRQDLMQITALDRGDKLSAAEIWAAVAELRDLQRPLCFGLFQLVGRFTFACYSDASGVMTLQEFHCAVHKMVAELQSSTGLRRGFEAAKCPGRQASKIRGVEASRLRGVEALGAEVWRCVEGRSTIVALQWGYVFNGVFRFRAVLAWALKAAQQIEIRRCKVQGLKRRRVQALPLRGGPVQTLRERGRRANGCGPKMATKDESWSNTEASRSHGQARQGWHQPHRKAKGWPSSGGAAGMVPRRHPPSLYPGADGSAFVRRGGATCDGELLSLDGLGSRLTAHNHEACNRPGVWLSTLAGSVREEATALPYVATDVERAGLPHLAEAFAAELRAACQVLDATQQHPSTDTEVRHAVTLLLARLNDPANVGPCRQRTALFAAKAYAYAMQALEARACDRGTRVEASRCRGVEMRGGFGFEVDLALEIHSHVVVAIGAGHARSSPVARAKAVRELSSLMVPGLFRVLDFDASGDIGTHEFLRGALLLLATVQGAPLDTPQLAELAFRLADSDGDGYVTALELGRWEPRGPFGLFGERRLEPAQLAAKWLREADAWAPQKPTGCVMGGSHERDTGADLDRDGKLLPDEFRVLAPRLRLHRVISSMAQCFAAQMPSE